LDEFDGLTGPAPAVVDVDKMANKILFQYFSSTGMDYGVPVLMVGI
tara:strand:+ start:1016 stop:1153 length:138 start_codon:yes stop_codon:yes gene_type:complete